MTENELKTAFDNAKLTTSEKEYMVKCILDNKPLGQETARPQKSRRALWYGTTAACFAIVLAIVLLVQLSRPGIAYALSITTPNGSNVLLEDKGADAPENLTASSVSFVDNGPQLRFFISGEDIATISISTENEYISATDFTKSLEEKYWNPELYYEETEIDGVSYQYIPAKSGFEKALVISFPQSFTAYDQVWYDWYGWNIREWATENNFSRIQGYDRSSAQEISNQIDTLSEEEKLAIAAGGGNTSAAGHILLDDYPKDLLDDQVTISITDRRGNTTTRVITLSVSNNTLGQTVVTANLME